MKEIGILIAAIGSIGQAALAGDWEPREEALKNIASGYAFLVSCSVSGYAQPESVARLGDAYQIRLTAGAYEQFRAQYQRSIHEKKIYSIAGKKWVPFSGGEEECRNADRGIELLTTRLLGGQQ